MEWRRVFNFFKKKAPEKKAPPKKKKKKYDGVTIVELSPILKEEMDSIKIDLLSDMPIEDLQNNENEYVICPNCGGSGYLSALPRPRRSLYTLHDPNICVYCCGTGSLPRWEAEKIIDGTIPS